MEMCNFSVNWHGQQLMVNKENDGVNKDDSSFRGWEAGCVVDGLRGSHVCLRGSSSFELLDLDCTRLEVGGSPVHHV